MGQAVRTGRTWARKEGTGCCGRNLGLAVLAFPGNDLGSCSSQASDLPGRPRLYTWLQRPVYMDNLQISIPNTSLSLSLDLGVHTFNAHQHLQTPLIPQLNSFSTPNPKFWTFLSFSLASDGTSHLAAQIKTLDSILSSSLGESYTQPAPKSCVVFFLKISPILPLLEMPTTAAWVHAVVTSHLDYTRASSLAPSEWPLHWSG